MHKEYVMVQHRTLIGLQIAIALAAVLFLRTVSAAQLPPASTAVGKIVRLDPRFDALVPRDAVLEKLADGFSWVEGPVWRRQGGTCCFRIFPITRSLSGGRTANVAWGGDGSVLYVTADTAIYRMGLRTKGVGFESRDALGEE
jgi:hypothetical protein